MELKRVEASVDVATDAIILQFARERKCSRAQVVREALEIGLRQMRTGRSTDVSRELAQAREAAMAAERAAHEATAAAKGTMALVSWFMPALFRQEGGGGAFLAYFSKQRPSKIYDLATHLSAELQRGKSFFGSLRQVPDEVGFDTNEFANCTREEWHRMCDENDRAAKTPGGSQGQPRNKPKSGKNRHRK